MKTRNRFIDKLYFIGIFLVLLGHSHPVGTPYPEQLILFIYQFHMPLFFVISGFLLVYSKSLKKKGGGGWAKDKLRKMLIPYFGLSLAAFLPKYIIQIYLQDNVELTLFYFLRIMLSPREGIWGHFWFMPVLLVLELLGSRLRLLLEGERRRFHKTLTAVIIIVISFALYMNPILVGWFGIEDITKELVFFIIGMITAYIFKESQWKADRKFHGRISGGIGLFLAAVLLSCSIGENKIAGLIITLLLIGATAAAACYIPDKLAEWLVPYKFTVYLLGWPFQAVAEIIINKILHMPWQLVFICLFLAGLAGPIVTVKLYRKTKIQCKVLDYMLGINSNERYVCKNIN